MRGFISGHVASTSVTYKGLSTLLLATATVGESGACERTAAPASVHIRNGGHGLPRHAVERRMEHRIVHPACISVHYLPWTDTLVLLQYPSVSQRPL